MDSQSEARAAFRAHIMEVSMTFGRLLGVRDITTYRASVILQRLVAQVEDQEVRRKTPATYVTLQKESNARPDPSLPSELRDVSGYDDVYHRIATLLSCADDTWLYLVAAAHLIVCKLDCPSVRIRVVLFALEKLLSRRRSAVLSVAYVTAATVAVPLNHKHAANPPAKHSQLPPLYYDSLKQQVVRAEMTLLLAVGFRFVVDLPHKYILLFLRFLLLADEPSEVSGTPPESSSNDSVQLVSKDVMLRRELFSDWTMDACHWANTLPHSTHVESFDAAVLAVLAIEATKPSDAAVREGAAFYRAKVTDLPADWMTAFGVLRSEVAAARSALSRDAPKPKATKSLIRLRTELTMRLTLMAAPPPPPPPPPVSPQLNGTASSSQASAKGTVPEVPSIDLPLAPLGVKGQTSTSAVSAVPVPISTVPATEEDFGLQLQDLQHVLLFDKQQRKQKEKAEKERLEKEEELRRQQAEAAAEAEREVKRSRREASRDRDRKRRRSRDQEDSKKDSDSRKGGSNSYFHVSTTDIENRNESDSRRKRSRSSSRHRRRSLSRDRHHRRRDDSEDRHRNDRRKREDSRHRGSSNNKSHRYEDDSRRGTDRHDRRSSHNDSSSYSSSRKNDNGRSRKEDNDRNRHHRR